MCEAEKIVIDKILKSGNRTDICFAMSLMTRSQLESFCIYIYNEYSAKIIMKEEA